MQRRNHTGVMLIVLCILAVILNHMVPAYSDAVLQLPLQQEQAQLLQESVVNSSSKASVHRPDAYQLTENVWMLPRQMLKEAAGDRENRAGERFISLITFCLILLSAECVARQLRKKDICYYQGHILRYIHNKDGKKAAVPNRFL